MKVASKVAVGSALLVVLFTGALAYQLLLVRDLVTIHRDLSTQKTHAARVTLEAIRLLDELEEYVRKLGVTRDAQYAARIGEHRETFAALLEELGAFELPPPGKAEVEELAAGWRRLPRVPAAADETKVAAAVAVLRELRRGSERLLVAIEEAIAEEAESSAAAGETAAGVALAVIAAALGLSVVVVALTVRSINEPLRRLVAGTRAVSEGEFDLELDTSRDDEFARLAADFNAMVHRLGELDEMKKDLLSHVSHELKTPLATIQETHQVLLDEVPGELNQQQRRLIELNLESSERLSRLISKLLDLSRLEAGVVGYDLAPREIGTLITGAVAALERRARARRLGVEVDLPSPPPAVRCDADRLLQVFDNLLENAIKFSPEGSVIGIRARPATRPPDHLPTAWRGCLADEDGFVHVTFSDAGPGVRDDEKELIFEKFHQAGSRRRSSVGGVGLGLAICREIVEAHGGAVWVRDNVSSPLESPQGDNVSSPLESPQGDNVPRGSIFHVLLPAAQGRWPPKGERHGAPRPNQPTPCTEADRSFSW